MESYGGEIGHKMRSAVKAKLVELGTGKSGYIDDELPDYVMIMVANKRSKQQMCNDLNLFLGEQTDLFVTWLHEVLQKLEEVTLPVANNANKKQKRKTSREGELPGGKKEKKSKKDKRLTPEPETAATPINAIVPTVNSITDVFAEEFLEKAKKSLDVDLITKAEIKKKKARKNSVNISTVNNAVTSPVDNSNVDTNEFDIPTISEISSSTENPKAAALSAREKDLAELAAIQRQIDLAKKQLKAKGELPKELLDKEDEIVDDKVENKEEKKDDPRDNNKDDNKLSKKRESIDQDFLNLKDDNMHDFSEASNEATEISNSNSELNKAKSPIVFDLKAKPEVAPVVQEAPARSPHDSRESLNNTHHLDDVNDEDHRKPTVHERLGGKSHVNHNESSTNSNSSRPSRARREQKLYVPAHRRHEQNSSVTRERNRSRSPNRSLKASPVRQSRDRTRTSSGVRRNYSPARRSARSPRRQSKSPRPTRRHSTSSSASTGIRKRIGSRVVVAPPRPNVPSDEEPVHDKPVNSIIKITPRTRVSPSKQASKNLLLKAVADAQRSTILRKTQTKKDKRPAAERLGRKTDATPTPLYTRGYKQRLENRRLSHTEASYMRNSSDREDLPTYSENESECEEKYAISDDDIGNERQSQHSYGRNATKTNTQFVVTLNEEKARSKLGKRFIQSRSSSRSPIPQVSSSTSASYRKATSSSHSRSERPDIRSRLSSNKRFKEEDESSPNSQRLIEFYRKPKEVEKLIIKPDTDEDEESHQHQLIHPSKIKIEKENIKHEIENEERSTTPPLPPSMVHLALAKAAEKKSKESAEMEVSLSPRKRKHEPIHFDGPSRKDSKENSKENLKAPMKKSRHSRSRERSPNGLDSDRRRDSSNERHSSERRKINTRKTEDRKYDNIPSLNSVPVDTSALKPFKSKERCIYHPNCTKNICEYYHPSAPCKAFPGCKFGDKCLYTHPKCKFDMLCVNTECNYMHSAPRNLPTAPPLSSHVVPVQSYKSISAAVATSTANVMCKYYPNCTKVGCSFYHPKPCRYGKNCINKLECAFYHPENQSCNKFKWVAQLG